MSKHNPHRKSIPKFANSEPPAWNVNPNFKMNLCLSKAREKIEHLGLNVVRLVFQNQKCVDNNHFEIQNFLKLEINLFFGNLKSAFDK